MDDLNKEVVEFVKSNLRVSPELYTEIKQILKSPYKTPAIQSIKHQVCQSMIFGTYISAMTLLNHMFEQFLKFSLMYNEKMKNEEAKKIDKNTPFAILAIVKPSNEKFFNRNLKKNIETAHEVGLIDQNQKDMLEDLADKYRNAYSHGDRRKLYGDERINIEEIRITNDEFVTTGKKAEEKFHFPFADFLFLHNHAEVNCDLYLKSLDEIIRSVENKIFPDFEPIKFSTG